MVAIAYLKDCSIIMKKVIFSALILGLVLISCKEETPNPTTEESPKVTLKLEHTFNGEPLDLESEFITANGDTVQFSELKYLLSNLSFLGNDNQEQKAEDSYYLVDLSNESNVHEIEIDGLNAGSYTSFKLGLGVDSVANHSITNAKGDLDPNGADQMIWSWNTGYKFVRCEGDYKKAENTGTFVFHIGTDANYRTFHFGEDQALNIKIENDKTTEIHLVIDLAELFISPNTIDLQVTNKAHGDNASVLMDNLYDSDKDGHYGWFELHHIETN